ncbi:restriction endonuclease subunit S [Campylobacter lari]|nr:restriction endonuclease subunit S [Campylobacter lari]
MNDWKKCKLGDICSKVTSGGTPLTSNALYYNGIIPWLNTKEVKNCRIYETEKYISQLGLENSSAKWIEANSVIVAMYGATAGKVAINKIPLTTNQACCNLTINHEKADYNFIYYLILNNFETLEILATGAAQQNLNLNTITSLEITLPPLEEQRQIAAILSSIDDKIELLHEQNKTLEELAQTFFVNWFKDREFDSTIGDFISIQNGFAFKSKDFIDCGDNGVIKIKNISNGIVDIVNTDKISREITNEVNDKFKINSGDILFAMTGAEIGKMGIVPNTNKKLWLNQRVGIVKESFLGARFLAYIHLTSEFGYDYVINSATGSAQENISATDIENCPFVKLTREEIVSYSKQLNDFFEKIIFNLGEIQTLENMRDILIPKLLNGERKE